MIPILNDPLGLTKKNRSGKPSLEIFAVLQKQFKLSNFIRKKCAKDAEIYSMVLHTFGSYCAVIFSPSKSIHIFRIIFA